MQKPRVPIQRHDATWRLHVLDAGTSGSYMPPRSKCMKVGSIHSAMCFLHGPHVALCAGSRANAPPLQARNTESIHR